MAPAKHIAVIAAGALALQAGTAQAQQPCVSEDEVSAAFVYAMPSLIDSATTRCSGSLAPGGFFDRDGKKMAARYAAQQAAAWPKARSALLKYVAGSAQGKQANGTLDLLSQVPGDTMRPLVDALIVQEASARLAPKDCGKVEKIASALAPLDPDEAGTLLGAIFAVVEPKGPAVCVARS